MASEEDWILRPVLANCIKYESLITPGALDLVDVWRLNDALDVRQENEHRAIEAERAKESRK